MGRREAKREATRQEVLSAAADLFRTKGYDATSVDDIALAANVAKGTFYYHFKAKEDLVFALQDAELKVAVERVEKRIASGDSPLEVLFDLLKHSAHWVEANPELERVMFRKKLELMSSGNHECSPEDGMPSAKQHFFFVIVELVSAAQDKTEIRKDIPAADLARVIIPVVMSARMHWLMDPAQESLAERIEKSLKVVLEGFMPKA